MLILLFMIRSTHKWIQFVFFFRLWPCRERHWLALQHIPILLILRCIQLSQFSVASSKSIRIILHRCYCFCCCRFYCCSRKCWCDARTWKRMKLILWWVMNITYIYYVFCQALSGAHGSHDDRRITWSSIMVCK